MKRITKIDTSEVLTNNYVYPSHSKLIREALEKEQEFFCAYYEDRLTAGYARDVEHFNPTLKGSDDDGYGNWFCVSHRLNMFKRSDDRWNEHQPIMLPTDPDLEDRLVYDNGYYVVVRGIDPPAKNLKDYLMLNQFNLPTERQSYIDMLNEVFLFHHCNKTEFQSFLLKYPDLVKFRTAIKAEFEIII